MPTTITSEFTGEPITEEALEAMGFNYYFRQKVGWDFFLPTEPDEDWRILRVEPGNGSDRTCFDVLVLSPGERVNVQHGFRFLSSIDLIIKALSLHD